LDDKLKIYLAGGMDGLEESVYKDWREYVQKTYNSYNIKFIDPTRRPHSNDLSVKEIYRLDLMDVENCDMILADIRYFPREVVGTSCELFYASEILKKPTIGWRTEDTSAPHIRLFMTNIITREIIGNDWKDSIDKSMDHIISYYIS
jgi:nucleoside 2-deoxyribosyltransferase